ncbi:hypothetical protein CQ10_09690 [Bradyrhizobium valentinum]|uniref:Uncharacterized protein n=1 Tax=Bradyrhizobium valentinum TaxID=1518501 RepID=A0A0R3L5F2_9BRAD|nr:hypothetical protein CP49_04105 [Bradyrhizobium valentinum]KRR14070.1 hypothetical protein CQ10_09690 [Bradyrhizobium valentinum]
MNDDQRSEKSDIELQGSSTRFTGVRTGRKVAIWLLATMIVLAMLAWLAFLGWGMITLWQWVFDHSKNLWTTYV